MPRIVFLFFFFSGFSTLVYEVAWVRLLALTLGNTSYATSMVLAVFMGGLALGAYLGGRLADKTSTSHLRLYAGMEFAIGICAPIVTYCLNAAPAVYANLVNSLNINGASLTAVRFLISFILLFLPCLLMGATLPAIIRFAKKYTTSEKIFATLYGTNTLGAAAGSLCACFLGFSYLGLNATIEFAAAINVGIGLAAFMVAKQKSVQTNEGSLHALAESNESPSPTSPSKSIASGESTKSGEHTESSEHTKSSELADFSKSTESIESSSRGQKIIYLLSLLTGFTALSYEVLWLRILAYHLGSLTYTFTVTVATILIGLGLGSFIYEQFCFKKGQTTERTFRVFAMMQYAAALTSIAAFFAAPLASTIRNMWIPPGVASLTNMTNQLGFTISVCVMCLLIPATFIGCLFPALGTMAANKKNQVGTAIGTIYAANTIGCVLGSIVAGLVLIPHLGFFAAFQCTVVLSLLTGMLALMQTQSWKKPVMLAWSIPPLIASLLFVVFIHYKQPVNPLCKLLFYGEDSLGAIAIIDDPKLMQGKTLVFNGSCLATTIPNSLRYMRLLGHLPALLHPHPDNALVGCFGTGSTSGAIASQPEVKRVDIVELSPLILSKGNLFAAENHNVLSNPKVHTHINDVRNYLLCSKEKFDIVTFEPPPPEDAGIVNLYTSEFYKLVQSHLKPGGIMCQWAPMNCGSSTLWKMTVATARTVYPHVSVWFPNSHQAIIVASDSPLKIDFEQIQHRIDESPDVQQSLAGVGLGDAMALTATLDVFGKELEDFLGDVPAITDDRPHLEFFLPYSGPWVSDAELEAAGLKQIDTLCRQAQNAPSFDMAKFQKNWSAIHLLRMAQYNDKDGEKYIEQATKLLPDNAWFQWVHRHSKAAILGQI